MTVDKIQHPRLVDAALISAMKSGSTYLAYICSKHPDIFLSKVRLDDSKIITDLEKYNGEKLVVVKRNMKPIEQDAGVYYSHNNNMKFVMLIRNPVLRAFSQFAHHVRKHLKLKKPINVHPQCINKNIYDINEDIICRKKEYIARKIAWVRKSEYYSCLSPFLKLFPRDNLFITPLELFNENPEHWIRKIFSFLDVPIIENIKGLNKTVNRGKYRVSFLDKITKRNAPEFIPLTDDSKNFFAELFIDDVYKISKLTGIDVLSIWKLNDYL